MNISPCKGQRQGTSSDASNSANINEHESEIERESANDADYDVGNNRNIGIEIEQLSSELEGGDSLLNDSRESREIQ